MSDDELVDAVYESSYSDMKWEDFLEEISDIPEPDKLTPMLDVLVELKNILLSQDRPVDYNDRFGDLEIAIKDLGKTMTKVKPPVVMDVIFVALVLLVFNHSIAPPAGVTPLNHSNIKPRPVAWVVPI